MLKQFLFGFIFAFFLTGCNSHPAANAGQDSIAGHPADTGQQVPAHHSGSVTISPALLKKYQEICLRDTSSYDKKFISDFFDIIKKFNGKKLDTTMLTIGNLEGNLDQDTIYSRVYYDADTIYVDSKWIKNNHILWKDKFTDPVMSLNADLLDSGRNTWVCFAIGVTYGPPDIRPREQMDSETLAIVYSQGVDDLNGEGIHIRKEQYKAYLQDFKGNLLAYGQPESREGVSIWYKPARRMITYFQP